MLLELIIKPNKANNRPIIVTTSLNFPWRWSRSATKGEMKIKIKICNTHNQKHHYLTNKFLKRFKKLPDKYLTNSQRDPNII